MILVSLLAACALASPSDPHIIVDQFGYRPRARKIAVLREAFLGHDAPDSYAPGAMIEVRRAADQSVAFSGPAVPWNGGAIHAQSGDRAWWFDFGALREVGTFLVHDPANGISSEPFEIGADVYDQVLHHALRMFLHQRCGVAKAAPHVEVAWNDPPCHLGPEQDLDCRAVWNPIPATSRDLSGGWHDAGDYNKYVNFSDDALHDLMAAFEQTPFYWGDDFGLPESGNGVPDLLDEIRFELEWLLKMQLGDGSVLHKVSVTGWDSESPASADVAARRYAPPTASATISACGLFARAARLFEDQPGAAEQALAAALRTAAIAAWNWLLNNPGEIPSFYDNAGFQNAAAEDSPYKQEMNRVRAAAQLFRLTGATTYRDFFDAGHGAAHLFQWGWASPWEQGIQDALLDYTQTPNATPVVVSAIRAAYRIQLSGPDHLGRIEADTDAYRAYLEDGDHTWGSNRTKLQQGLMYLAMNRFGLDVAHADTYLAAAEDYLHYIHGVNPNGLTYLTNMAATGAEQSVDEMYHGWFGDGTVWDNASSSLYGPPPGYLTGGANPSYAPDAAYTGPPIEPPQNQPILKSYLDWNTDWPQNSWQVTECHIPYQAAYIRLLTEFTLAAPTELGLELSATLFAGGSASLTLDGASPGATLVILFAFEPGAFHLTSGNWALDLGLDLLPNPAARILLIGNADGSGRANWNANVPPGLAGITLLFQAAQSQTSPWPVQSAVIPRTVQ